MLSILRTNAADPTFINLVEQLDADLAIRDGKEHGFYAIPFNKSNMLY